MNVKISSELTHNPEAFSNKRYAVHLDSYINLQYIDQLNHDLGAVNPILAKSVQGHIYLTADKFKNLSFIIEKARSLGNVDSYDTCELIHVGHWLFSEVSFYF